MLTVRDSGIRIGDCTGLQESHLKSDTLFLNTQKSSAIQYRDDVQANRSHDYLEPARKSLEDLKRQPCVSRLQNVSTTGEDSRGLERPRADEPSGITCRESNPYRQKSRAVTS